MKILIVGSGGREDALAWKIAQDSSRPRVFCAPGNAGTARRGTNVPIEATDIDGLLTWATAEKPDLVVVGPEAPLCAGLADRLEAAGVKVFGPRADAARLEGSKAFSKDVMRAAGVPTAAAERFRRADDAFAYVRKVGAPMVVKADGLAAGKGVTVCPTVAEAERAVRESLVDRAFGDAGNEVLVEECLVGEEASILALIDGEHIVMLASSQDHKRVFDGDGGPNTGGMGAYSPAPVVRETDWPLIRSQVFEPTLAELRRRGILFRGVLYAGLMVTERGPKVLEFNCRFGDPETQAILPRWKGDILPALFACAEGRLRPEHVQWREDACVCVVMTAGGYPGAYTKGHPIAGIDAAEALPDVTVFHAGTRVKDGQTVTAGGRVLGVTALGRNIRAAVERAYEGVARIEFRDAHFRRDIAARALNRRDV